MAERRMFAKTIIDSDAFLDMPLSSQALYFHLSMRADDDGFINNPKKIQRMIGSSDDDLKLLVAKKFVIPFENGVCVIKHWKIHNYIRNDRYTETVYKEEKAQLEIKENKAYKFINNLGIPSDIPTVVQMDTQVRLGKVRLGKDSIDKKKKETDFDILIKDYTNNEELKINIYEFIKMRKGIKAAITTLGLKKMLNKLDSLTKDNKEKIRILDNSIMNSWKGIFPLNKQINNKNESKSLKFNNFEARDYNYDDLEKKLLGWDKDNESSEP